MIAGIDPGVQTGVALWDGERLTRLRTCGILDAMDEVLASGASRIVMEDARLRGGAYVGPERALGAGSVRRDCGIWTEFAARHGLVLRSVSPKDKGAKVDAQMFGRITGWDGGSSQHSRDAAMLVFGLRERVT